MEFTNISDAAFSIVCPACGYPSRGLCAACALVSQMPGAEPRRIYLSMLPASIVIGSPVT